jgi:hypothetical protein
MLLLKLRQYDINLYENKQIDILHNANMACFILDRNYFSK